MLYEYDGDFPDEVEYVCNAVGEMNCDENELSTELTHAFNELWSDDYGLPCYLFRLNGCQGIAFEAEYDGEYAYDLDVSYDDLCEFARSIATFVSKRLDGTADVIFGKDCIHWSNGENSTSLIVFLPWYTDVSVIKDVNVWFPEICYPPTK